jgi:elongation factor Tu
MAHMTVDDVFSIRGRGTVATGKIEDGTLRVGDEVWINDQGPVRIDGIEQFRAIVDQAQTGDEVGLLFRTLDKGQIERGDVVSSTPGPR